MRWLQLEAQHVAVLPGDKPLLTQLPFLVWELQSKRVPLAPRKRQQGGGRLYQLHPLQWAILEHAAFEMDLEILAHDLISGIVRVYPREHEKCRPSTMLASSLEANTLLSGIHQLKVGERRFIRCAQACLRYPFCNLKGNLMQGPCWP